MEAYSYSYSSSSTSSSTNPKPFDSSLRTTIRTKTQIAKPWTANRKPHTAPPPPNPPRVYKVDPINFRDLVQRLTGSTSDTVLPPQQHQQQPRRLPTLAPPRLLEKQLLPTTSLNDDGSKRGGETSPFTAMCRELMMEDRETASSYLDGDELDGEGITTSLELNLPSPAAAAGSQYCWYPPMLSNAGNL